MFRNFVRSRAFLLPAVVALWLAVTADSLHADNGWWNTSTGTWTNTASWWTTAAGSTAVAAVPTTSNTATFNGTGVNGAQTIYLNGAQAAAALVFANTGSTTLLGGVAATPASNTLTLGGTAGITVNAAAGAVTIGSSGAAVPITLGVAQTWTNNSANALTIGSTITPAGFALTKAGTGTLILSASSTLAGLTVSGGTLQADGTGLRAAGLTMSGGGRLDLKQDMTINVGIAGTAGLAGSGGTVSSSGGRLLLGGGSGGNGPDWSVSSSGTTTISAVIADGGASNSIDFFGGGTFILSGQSTFTGGLTVYSTAVRIAADSVGSVGSITSSPLGVGNLSFGSSGNGSAGGLSSDGATPRLILNPVFINHATSNTIGNATHSGKLTFSGTTSLANSTRIVTINSEVEFAGTVINGGLTKAGSALLTLSASNSYVSATTVNAGTLQLGNGGTAGSLNTASTIGGLAGATLAFNRSNTVTQGTDFASVIGGSINLTKQGSGALLLNGLNTYSGTTQVSAGLLHVTSSGSINNTASVVVNGAGAEFRYNAGSALTKPLTLTQGTLSGTGTLNTAVTVGSNAIHSPGNSPGSQTVQSETWASGGTYLWEVNDWNGAAGTAYDQINVTNTLDLTATSGSTFKIAVTGLTAGNAVGAVPNFSNTARKAFTIATSGSLTNFAANKLQIDTASFSGSNALGNGGFVAAASGNDVTLTFIPSAVYDLAATPNNAVILVGGTSTITATVTNNTTGRTNPDSINFTGLSLTGGLSPSPASGSGIAAGGSGSGSAVFTGLTSGSFSFTPGIGSVTNATLGTAALAGTTSAASVTVLDHATSSLAGSLLTSTTISLGSWNYSTQTWDAGSGTGLFSIFNLAGAGGAALTADLALLSVSGSGSGFTTNLGSYTDIAGGQFGQYSISVDPASFLSSGTQSRTFTISLGDPTNLSGAATSNTLSVTAQVIVVPEPGAVALAGIGIAAAAWALRRRVQTAGLHLPAGEIGARV